MQTIGIRRKLTDHNNEHKSVVNDYVREKLSHYVKPDDIGIQVEKDKAALVSIIDRITEDVLLYFNDIGESCKLGELTDAHKLAIDGIIYTHRGVLQDLNEIYHIRKMGEKDLENYIDDFFDGGKYVYQWGITVKELGMTGSICEFSRENPVIATFLTQCMVSLNELRINARYSEQYSMIASIGTVVRSNFNILMLALKFGTDSDTIMSKLTNITNTISDDIDRHLHRVFETHCPKKCKAPKPAQPKKKVLTPTSEYAAWADMSYVERITAVLETWYEKGTVSEMCKRHGVEPLALARFRRLHDIGDSRLKNVSRRDIAKLKTELLAY